MDHPGDEWNCQRVPETVEGADFSYVAECARPAQRQRPKKCDQRTAQDEQRSGDEHEDLVLRHVRGKEYLSPRVQWRDESDEECEPAEGETKSFPGPNRAAFKTVQAEEK